MEEIKEKKAGGKSNVILIIVALIIMAGVVAWFVYYSVSSRYFTTDNAKVSSSLYNVVSATGGKLLKLNVAEGDMVQSNQILARVENGPYLKAPVDGEVISCDVSLGQSVAPSSVIAIIADTNDVSIQANIEETDIAKIAEGQSVKVSLDAYPGKSFTGRVERVDKVTQTALKGNMTSFTTSGTYTKVTQLIPVKIVVDNVELKNIIGTNAQVSIKIK